MKKLVPTWRKWLQFRLRTLLILTTLCAAVSGTLGRAALEARRQQAAVATRKCLQVLDTLPNLQELRMAFLKLGNGALSPVAKLTNLEILDLTGTRIGNESIASLRKLASLREMGLSHNRVDDGAIVTLQSFGRLQTLDLFNTDVTSPAERQLRRRLPGCKVRFVYWASGDSRHR